MTIQTTGRMIGGLLLVQLIAGVLNMQVLTAPLLGSGDYLSYAASHELRIGISVLITLVGGFVTLLVAALAWPVLRLRGEVPALLFVLLSIAGAVLGAVEQVGILSMREFSAAYLDADPVVQAQLESIRVAGATLRNGAHYMSLLAFGATMGVWYFCLLRFALLPRVLAAAGLLAVALQLYSISLPVLGSEVSFALLAPIGLMQLLHAGWLLAFGFRVAEDAGE